MAGIEHDRLTSAESQGGDRAFDRAIRPTTLAEYVGQPGVKQQMGIFIEAARRRSEALDHVLIFGPPGLGKTTLAHIVAHEMGVNLRHTSGPVSKLATTGMSSCQASRALAGTAPEHSLGAGISEATWAALRADP